VNFAQGFAFDRAGFVHRLADHVHDAAQRRFADRHLDRLARIVHFLTAGKALGGVHGDGAHRVFTQMLRHFEHQPGTVIIGLQRVHDGRQVIVEFDVHDGANHLTDLADNIAHTVYPCFACREAVRRFPVIVIRRGRGRIPYLRRCLRLLHDRLAPHRSVFLPGRRR